MSIAQALAMTVAEIPVFLYSTFGQVNNVPQEDPFKYTIEYVCKNLLLKHCKECCQKKA